MANEKTVATASKDSRPSFVEEIAHETIKKYRALQAAFVAALATDDATAIATAEESRDKVLADLDGHKPLATGDEAKKLFAEYSKTDASVQAAKLAVDAATEARSKVVEEIRIRCGKGPFKYQGRILTVTQRGATLFFKSPSKNEVTDI